MAHPLYHARSSAHQFGGEAYDYLPLHQFFDQTKMCVPSNIHRLILHHTFGIKLCLEIYGPALCRASDGVSVETEIIAQQHITEDFGLLPTLQECLRTHPLYAGSQKLPVHVEEEIVAGLLRKFGGQPADYQEMISWFYRPGVRLDNLG